MKVAIVTLFGNFNYGNRLQNYAVQKILNEMEFSTDTIYIKDINKTIFDVKHKILYKTPIKTIKGISGDKVLYFKREEIFDRFTHDYIKTRHFADVKDIKGYDYYVLGSDQVWNPKRYDSTKKELFFLTFTDSEKKVCFSPSFGVEHIPLEWKEYFAKWLKTFPKLSVREHSGAKIIKELTGSNAEVLIDPTLMLDKNQWMSIAKAPRNVDLKKEYILTYFLGEMPDKAVEDSRKTASNNGLYVYNLMSKEDDVYLSGPSEFLYLMDNARLILTDSFHACVFAFLLKKPFLLYAREGEDSDMLSRIETLFDTFDLTRKYSESGIDNDLFECNYENGYKRLAVEREKVYAFLRRSMNI